ncbi:MAG TPA: cobalt-precorrin-5B (C(1))-methyltransferase [Synechococcales cyanobacterium M55_K2018_004]|nr:cobalt-precorrin-5B (C(1))-methyltransferase [Synechococcales cyanobacterium M55_K2018_004]
MVDSASGTSPRAGYTLPVFACAAAIAALRWLQEDLTTLPDVTVDLVEPPQQVVIPVEQVARLGATTALAITRSDPGDNLDLTRNTPVWALVERFAGDGSAASAQIAIAGGEGIGRLVDAANQPAIYAYARRLLETNLAALLTPDAAVRVTLVLPEGRSLAERTSNAAFGVVDGLSLLGTAGISQPLSAPGQLEAFRAELQQKATQYDGLVFCVGENGLDFAAKLGIPSDRRLKTANWLGPLLVEAALQGVQKILLFGYHGKLIKLAGGIFHTHHHVADGRQEIFAAHCGTLGLPTQDLQVVLTSPTVEAGLAYLRQLDQQTGSDWVDRVYAAIAQQVDQRSAAYIHTHCDRTVEVGCLLFDRSRRVIVQSKTGATLLREFVTLS